MKMTHLHCTLLDPQQPGWAAAVDQLHAALGAPHNPLLLPVHFLKATFPRIGGKVVAVYAGDRLHGVVLLFPRLAPDGRRAFTARVQTAPAVPPIAPDILLPQLAALVDDQPLTWYDPCVAAAYTPDYLVSGDLLLGRPTADEASAARSMQQTIWHSRPDELYPADLYSTSFQPGTGLVARRAQQVVAFLLGFHAYGRLAAYDATGAGSVYDRWIESQLMGSDPALRRNGLAARLKWQQAATARAAGIAVVHWTADPLQFGNAVLNFARLRAVAGQFFPEYYTFRNVLNQVPAARFGISWLVDSPRVHAAAEQAARGIQQLDAFAPLEILNAAAQILIRRPGRSVAAVEIPADWTTLQHSDPQLAHEWRAVTGALFADCIGFGPGQYVVTDVAMHGERRYLILRRAGGYAPA